MQKKTISLLQCPYCETSLAIKKIIEARGKEAITAGVVQCACDVYPIVKGILYLQKDQEPVLKNRVAVQLLLQGDVQQATELLIQERRRAKLPYLFLLHSKLVMRSSLSFFLKIASYILPESKPWFTYLKKREFRPTFLLSLTNLSYLQKPGAVVDIGCGIGHFLKYIRATRPSYTCIGMDTQFSLLLIAAHYVLDTKVDLICADSDMGLPFKDSSVQYCTVNDAFMYLKKKKFIIHEATRVISKSGYIFLSHVHTNSESNVSPGYPLSSKESRLVFEKNTAYQVEDATLFSSIINNSALPYIEIAPIKSKRRSISSSFILRKNKHNLPKVGHDQYVLDFFDTYKNLFDWLEDSYLGKRT